MSEASPGQPAVEFGSTVNTEISDPLPAGSKKTLALVRQRAQTFLDVLHAGALAALKREILYQQLAEVVFAYWAARLNHPLALLDKKREQRILARLRESRGDWGLLLYAVDGALKDDWLMGRRVDSTRKYDGVETVFRDRAQVERLAELCIGFQQQKPHPIVEKYRADDR